MLGMIRTGLLWFGAIGCAVIGGVYFAFSAFVMTALGSIDHPSGIAAMQSINRVILGSLFMPLFFATTVACAALVGIAISQWSSPSSRLLAVASCVFIIGMFFVTVFGNVPLNDSLASNPPATTGAAALWQNYLTSWTRWNHVRTVACMITSAIYIHLLALKS